MAKIVKSADTQLLVNKVTEVGKRATLDKTRLLALSTAIAQQTGNNATEGIKTILSDGSVTPVEKKQLKLLREQINTTNATLLVEAEKYEKLYDWSAEDTQVAEAYLASYQAFLSELDELLVDMDKTSTVDRETLTALTEDYYTKQETLDLTLQKFRYGVSKIEFFYLATSDQYPPDEDDIIDTNQPQLTPTLKFLWRKTVLNYTSGAVKKQIDLLGVYGDTGKECSITCDKTVVIRNDRIDGVEQYTFTINVKGYTGVVTAKVGGSYQTLVTANDKYVFTYNLPYKEAYSLTATFYIDNEEKGSITLEVENRTTKASYVGVYSEAPTILSATEHLVDGDWYLNSTDKCVYVRDESLEAGWRAITSEEYMSEHTEDLFKISECLADMIRLGTTDSTTATLLGVFQKLCTNEAFIRNLFAEKIEIRKKGGENGLIQSEGFDEGGEKRFRIQSNGEAEFYGIKVKQAQIYESDFEGEITSDVLSTLLTDGDAIKYASNIGTQESATINTLSAEAVYDNAVISNIYSRVNNTLNAMQKYSANGTLLGRTDFDSLVNIDSVSSSWTTLNSYDGGTSLDEYTLSWTNSYPCSVQVKYWYTAKSVSYDTTETTLETEAIWTVQYSSTEKPKAREGKWSTVTAHAGDYAYWNHNIEQGDDGYYTWDRTCYKWVEVTSEVTKTSEGSVTVTNGGSEVSRPSTASTITVASGQTLSIKLGTPHSSGYSPYGGSITISWKKSDNFSKTGILFCNGGSKSFYLADINTYSAVSKSTDITINGVKWVYAPIGSATAWQFNSSYGNIIKLFKFRYNSDATPSASASVLPDLLTSDTAFTYVDQYGTTRSFAYSSITSLSFGPTLISVNSGGSVYGISTSSYIGYCSLALYVRGLLKGVHVKNTVPKDDNSYTLGTPLKYWRAAYINSISGNLTGNVNYKGDKTHLVYGAVFN